MRTLDWVPEAQELCMKQQTGSPKWKCPGCLSLFSFPSVNQQPWYKLDCIATSVGITPLLTGGLVAVPCLFIVCLKVLWGSGFGDAATGKGIRFGKLYYFCPSVLPGQWVWISPRSLDGCLHPDIAAESLGPWGKAATSPPKKSLEELGRNQVAFIMQPGLCLSL